MEDSYDMGDSWSIHKFPWEPREERKLLLYDRIGELGNGEGRLPKGGDLAVSIQPASK